MFKDYLSEQRKYADRKQIIPKKKGAAHEQQTLELLARFKSKLNSVMYASSDSEDGAGDAADDGAAGDDDAKKISTKSKRRAADPVRDIKSDNEDDVVGDDWLGHTLRFEEKAPVLAKDASTKKDDWYDAFDPRNPLNKRKRGDETTSGNKSQRHRDGSSMQHSGPSSKKR